MPSVTVQLGVLAIARDPARVDASGIDVVAERAASAGHEVVARKIVGDVIPAIRQQLTTWIADPRLDAIIVLGGDSDGISKALRPLISEPLPGFTDLFRLLMFQESGAAAMLSSAEAARCDQTFIFVLPGAIAATMDKLILPQFDPATTPKNLVGQMPRLKVALATTVRLPEAVPAAIPAEKTQGGSGISHRLPAFRDRPKTGANVIVRPGPADHDPPTKPIDLGKLEQQLALSSNGPENTETTRPTDLQKLLPRVPPGADDLPDDDTTTDTVAAPPAVTIQPRSRGGSGNPATASTTPRTPAASAPTRSPAAASTPARSPAAASAATRSPAGTARPPTGQQPIVTRPRPPTGQSPVVGRPRPPTGQSPTAPDARAGRPITVPPSIPARTSQPTPAVPLRSVQPTPAVPVRAAHATPVVPATTAPRAPTTPPPRANASTPPALPTTKPLDGAPGPRLADTAPGRSGPVVAKSADASKSASTASAVEPEVDARASILTEEIEPIDAEALDEPAPTPPPAAAGKLAATTTTASKPAATTPPPAAARVRQPTPPPPPVVKRAESARAESEPERRRAADDDLPRGAFSYPTKRRRVHPVLLILGALAIAAGGFFLVVKILGRDSAKSNQTVASATTTTTAPSTTTTSTTAPSTTPSSPDVAAPTTTTPPPAADIELEPDVVRTEPSPPSTTRPTTATTTTTRPKTTTSSAATTTSAATTSSGPVTSPSGTDPKPDTTTNEGAAKAADTTAPAAADSDCDEAGCVLENYGRPCCAKYKPADTGIARRVDGVPETLDKAMVRSGIAVVKPRVIKCGEKSTAKGTVKIAIAVAPDGAVTEATVADAPDAGLGACVADVLKKARFAKTVNGASFTYPFAF